MTKDRDYDDEEAQRRFEATLRGALKTPPLPHGRPVKDKGGKDSPLAQGARDAADAARKGKPGT